jgi:hypothetical protein
LAAGYASAKVTARFQKVALKTRTITRDQRHTVLEIDHSVMPQSERRPSSELLLPPVD